MPSLHRNQSGAGLIVVIVILLIVGTIAAVFVSLISTESFTAINQSTGLESIGIAEGGLEYILENRIFPNYSTGGTAITLGTGGFTVDTPTYLTADPGAAGATITVQSTANFPASGRIVIDSELIDYTGTTAATFTGATRGAGGTVATAHPSGNAVFPVTVLTADPGAAGTTINVNSTTGFLIPGAIKIGSEYIYCTATTATTFTNCTRGYRGTTAAAHAAGSSAFQYIVTSTGTVTVAGVNAQRVVKASVDRAGGGGAITNGSFASDISGWTEILTNTDGSSAWSNYPTTGGGSPGSLLAQTNTGRGLRFAGYRWQGISIPSGANVTFTIDYCKNATGNIGGGSRMDTSVVIVYQGGVTFTVWSDTSQPILIDCSNENNWPATVNTSFVTTNNVIEVRIVYDLRNRGGPQGDGTKKEAWFDNVSLTSPGGPSAITWQEWY